MLKKRNRLRTCSHFVQLVEKIYVVPIGTPFQLPVLFVRPVPFPTMETIPRPIRVMMV